MEIQAPAFWRALCEEEGKRRLTIYKPEYRDLWFRQFMLSDPETMSYNHAWGGTISFPEERWQEWYDFWIREPEGKRFYRYLKDETGIFVGEIAYHFDSGLNGFIADVIVLASQRGKGYGDEALELLCNEAAKNGVAVLYDDIAIDNPAITLFEKHGFIEESRTEEKIILKRETKEPEKNMAENHKTKVARRDDWKTSGSGIWKDPRSGRTAAGPAIVFTGSTSKKIRIMS
ncbi:MAG: GNAT family N-acetyltransferase [Lachnospiraceae bacterium]|nr:GNAT family N-acetyltransferase [Lachnospiraceae bacterium]